MIYDKNTEYHYTIYLNYSKLKVVYSKGSYKKNTQLNQLTPNPSMPISIPLRLKYNNKKIIRARARSSCIVILDFLKINIKWQNGGEMVSSLVVGAKGRQCEVSYQLINSDSFESKIMG